MRYVVFGVSGALTAAVVVFVWVAFLSHYPLAALPHAAMEQLKSFPADTRALVDHSFAGFLRSGEQEHWVRVSCAATDRRARAAPSSPQPLHMEVTLADGSGSPTFAGWVDPATGELHLYIERESSRFARFRRVEGKVTGPALVNGVPTLYIEASPVSTLETSDDETERWVGHLVVQETR